MAAGLLAACHAGPRNFENENDRLRKENLGLQEQVGQLQKNITLRIAEIQAMEQMVAATRPALPDLKLSDLPQAVVVKFDRYTGPIDTNADGNDDTIRIYVRTLDQQGRFIPVTAKANLQAVQLAPEQPPRLIAEVNVAPPEFDKAYRSGMTGTHYTFDLPLKSLPADVKQVTLKVTLTDASTGVTMSCEQAFALKRK